MCIIEGNFCFDFTVICTLAIIEEWNQDHFEDDIKENFETEVEVETENELELEIAVKKVEAVAVFNKTLEWAENECMEQNYINVLSTPTGESSIANF